MQHTTEFTGPLSHIMLHAGIYLPLLTWTSPYKILCHWTIFSDSLSC